MCGIFIPEIVQKQKKEKQYDKEKRKKEMTKNEAILVDYILNQSDCCPFENQWEGTDLEQNCVGFREIGCGECIIRNIDRLDC